MKLSIVIVNYNVKAYLEQCLRAVFDATNAFSKDGLTNIAEVFVVDNLSTDGSVEMVHEKFPEVRLIANTENVGFSRANNQAIRESQGDYLLLLNPDTIVSEDVFTKVVAFMDENPKAGGVGVKMVDGSGRFLPESKRGLPTPSVAFFKIIGLARMFPRSRVFGRYHLGHLSSDRNAKIEILSGACMFLRKRTLDEVGLLDESFFMYGEDIDLSYRIILGGYENHYYSEAKILHYKGESTKKSSVNYVFVFYNAMAIFARKYFTKKRHDLFSALINGSIYLSAAAAIVSRFVDRAVLPITDLLTFIILLIGIGPLFSMNNGHTVHTVGWLVPGVSIIAILALFGAYDRPIRLSNLLRAGVAMAVAFTVWSLFSENSGMRPLNAVVFVGLGLLAPLVVRLVLHALHVRGFSLRDRHQRRILAIGSKEEAAQALSLLWQTHFGLGRTWVISPEEAVTEDGLRTMHKLLRDHRCDEVVFCAADMPWGSMIDVMHATSGSGVAFKVAQPGSTYIIGANSTESLQDLFILDTFSVRNAASRRAKRALDVAVSVVLLLTLPVNVWFIREKGNYMDNLFAVLSGKMSWVGFQKAMRIQGLPRLRPGVLEVVQGLRLNDPLAKDRMEVVYAKDYRAMQDLGTILRCFDQLGGR